VLNLIVVSEPGDWPATSPEYEVVTAREYLTERRFAEHPRLRVINIGRSFRYQKAGYYTSLLATARDHKPLPALATVQEARSPSVARRLAEDIDEVVQEALAPLPGPRHCLDSYFGRDPTGALPRLAGALFKRFPAPLLRATFDRGRDGWQLSSLGFLSPTDVPPEHRGGVEEALRMYLAKRPRPVKPRPAAYDLAILVDADDPTPPSNEEALKRFVRAAEATGLQAEIIDKRDYGRVPQFDALFLRETTAINHRTYRFAQRAAAEGLVVIDDPDSILRCANKVFLAELLQRYGIAAPTTRIVHRGNVRETVERLGLPLILKQPDSSSSLGVVKADTATEFEQRIAEMLKSSELVVAQTFAPTPFDWRIGVLDRRPLFAAKYHMAPAHWKVVEYEGRQEIGSGKVEAVGIGDVPRAVIETALRAANLMGDSLYGVDLKEIDGKPIVIEVNDNPNIDSGSEDQMLGPDLYTTIMKEFRRRLDRRRSRPNP
jgi:glutathione synthase/RimK-type ligase-like ATP-grasp enzyme